MSRDVITVGSTMRIPLLYRGEYSQWREWFMNYLKEQTDSEAMINSIKNGDHPLPVIAQVSLAARIKDNVDTVPTQQYILLPLLYNSPQSSEDAVADDASKKTNEVPANDGESYANNTNKDSTVSPSVSTAGQIFTNADDFPTDPLMPNLEDTTDLLNTGIFSSAYDDEDVGAEADLNNLETTMNVSPIPTTRIHKDHPKDQIIGDINSATQTRRMTKITEEHAMKVTQALTDPSWIEAMQDELLQFRLQKVWRLVNLPKGKHAIGTKWVYRNKKDKRGLKKSVKRIFRYLKGRPKLGLWYPKDSPIILEAFSNSDYAGASLDRKSTIGGKVTPLFDSMLVQNQAPEGEGSATPPEPQPTPSTSQLNVSEPLIEPLQTETPPPVFHEPQTEAHFEQILPSPSTYHRKSKTKKRRRTKKDTTLPQTSVPHDLGADEAVHKEGGDSVERAITTATSLDAAQDRNGYRWQSQAPRYHGGAPAQTRSERVLEKPNEPPLLEGHTSGSGKGSMEYHFELTDNVPPTPYDSPVSGDNTPGSDEGRMKLIKELMETCTLLTKRVLALEEAKTGQDSMINKLKLRVKRQEKKTKARTLRPMKRRLFKVRVKTSTDTSLGEYASKQEQ
ncbi:hypothetical protein Tco_1146350 [Tanacetum coccineum]